MEKCIFCDSSNIEVTPVHIKQMYMVECPLCISYIISIDAINDNIINGISQEDKILFSAYLRNNFTKSNPMTILSGDILRIPEITSPYKNLSAIDKVNRVIFYLATQSRSIGAALDLDCVRDYTKFYCKTPTELRQIFEYLREVGIIKDSTYHKGPVLTIEGWQKFESLKEVNQNSKKVFVAMNFDGNLKYIYDDAIYPACKECGFDAFRADSKEHNEKICDKIIADIRSSRFIIADFTGQKHGVYFEAGFAQGLRLQVIWTCKKSEEKNLNFDTRQYNHLLWEGAEDLKNQLINRIKATIR